MSPCQPPVTNSTPPSRHMELAPLGVQPHQAYAHHRPFAHAVPAGYNVFPSPSSLT